MWFYELLCANVQTFLSVFESVLVFIIKKDWAEIIIFLL